MGAIPHTDGVLGSFAKPAQYCELMTLMNTAVIKIERPARWGKQLASHLGNKIVTTEIDGGWLLTFPIGTAKVLPGEETLQLVAEADTEENLDRIKQVTESHLRRFAEEKVGELAVSWA